MVATKAKEDVDKCRDLIELVCGNPYHRVEKMSEDKPYYGDNLTPDQRRRTMQAVRSRDTVPEVTLRRALRDLGISGYRLNVESLPGKPDVTFGRRRLAVFVDGAYWHGRSDRLRPGRSRYWDEKIRKNSERDRATGTLLRSDGWRVLRLWDDEVMRDPEGAARKVLRRLTARPMAEFFAGIGLVGVALEDAGFEVVFANDISPVKRNLYAANRDVSKFWLEDIRRLSGRSIPSVELATASFPCTDISLAGWRKGINGGQSSMFWEFTRILSEMEERRPKALLIENVAGLKSSHGGSDLAMAIHALNNLGYVCDIIQLDARHWVPQSRQRVFIVCSTEQFAYRDPRTATNIRPKWVGDFVREHAELKLQAAHLPPPPKSEETLSNVVEHLSIDDQRWWTAGEVASFRDSLSRIQRERFNSLMQGDEVSWRTAYRRTRGGRATWEIRADMISGCLRTARGGSSRQALVEAAQGEIRVRWMTSREYARLMGAPDFDVGTVSENQALFGLGDAVCVPAVSWLGRNYLTPLLAGEFASHVNGSGASAH